MSQAVRASTPQDEPAEALRPAYDLIELFFFAYRDFVADADRMLAEYGFGRAHHRVLHFVSRQPGLRVADLLDVLRITKQSLNRVLKELIDKGFIRQIAGTIDRRERLLYPTEIGAELAQRLAEEQTRRLSRALAGREKLDRPVSRFLLGMIDPGERKRIRRVMAGLNDPVVSSVPAGSRAPTRLSAPGSAPE